MQYSPSHRDYKPVEQSQPAKVTRLHWFLLGILLSISTFIIMLPSEDAGASRTEPLTDSKNIEQASKEQLVELGIPEKTRPQSSEKAAQTENSSDQASKKTQHEKPFLAATSNNWQEVTVSRGDTLSTIFSSVGLSARTVFEVVETNDDTRLLTRIYPGQTIRFDIQDKKLVALEYAKSRTEILHVTRIGDRYEASLEQLPVEKRIAYANGEITDSLFLSAQRTGLSDKTTMELASIFGWDIDFVLDIRQGDSFTLMYEQEYLDDEKLKDGRILAASFTNQGKTFYAVYYDNGEDIANYFTPEGKSMRKAFLRTPVAFSRISSRFSLGRKHPILNKIRAHKGVDYAAPRGTPIKATGDGKIVHRGTKGGYGRVVIIQHGQRYNTLYAHMDNYKRGQRVGSRVKQGDVIGYVGSSGLATGPHLHYEFRVNGVHRNPLTIKLPQAEPLPSKYLADFKTHASEMLAKLELIRNDQVAQLELRR